MSGKDKKYLLFSRLVLSSAKLIHPIRMPEFNVEKFIVRDKLPGRSEFHLYGSLFSRFDL